MPQRRGSEEPRMRSRVAGRNYKGTRGLLVDDRLQRMAPTDPAPETAPTAVDTPLDKLAVKLVGDGKEPNLFFVSHVDDEGKQYVSAIFCEEDDAVGFADGSFAYVVEDRAEGVVWSSPAYDEANPDEEEEEEEEEEVEEPEEE